MEKQDYYSVLGIHRSATRDTIRKAYKLKALELHPDKNPEGEAVFKQVVNAYQTLNDPSARSAYDRELTRHERGFAVPRRYPHNPPQPPPASSAATPFPRNAARDGASRKPQYASDEQLFKDAYDQYRKNPFSGAKANSDFRGPTNEGSFAEWFKKKQEELRRAEEISKAKAEYARNLEKEEQQRAEEWRKMQRQREMEREEELQRAREKREQEQEQLRREKAMEQQAQQAAERKAMMEAYAKEQQQQQEELDRHLHELADQKRELEVERQKLADERERASQAVEETRSNRFALQKLREEELAMAVRRAEEKVQEAQVQKALQEALQRRREEEQAEEESRLQQEKKQLQEELAQEEQRRKEEVEHEKAARRRASCEMTEQRKRVMDLMRQERERHEEDVAAMRRETDRIEAEMRAKLEALREAKKSGQPINLEEWKL